MPYQELCFSAFVLGAAIASDNCRHPRNMPPRHARSTPMPSSQVAARSKRARRKVALHFWSQRHVLSTQWNFLSAGRAFDRDQRMLELWNNWYETLASSAEALAIVIVIVVVAAGVTTLAESRR